MKNKLKFSDQQALAVGTQLKLDWTQIDLVEFRRGLEMELESDEIDVEDNLTSDDLVLTGKIVWAHLNEIRDYYTCLSRLEAQENEQLEALVDHSSG